MFIALAASLPGTATAEVKANQVLRLDAPTVSFLMEAAWSSGGPGLLSTIPLPNPAPIGINVLNSRTGFKWSAVWDHLIYAYMIENTRIYEIFGRVIWEYGSGERLGIPANNATFQWLRTTEELFYKDASPFQPFNLVSRMRPDIAASRRNAYYRMFGMDLNHGRDGGTSYAYVKPPAANREFVATFEEFLREVWRAIENAANIAGPNQTDFAAIVDLAVRLQNMLTARRGGGPARPNLSRDEFLAVSLASWLDLTLRFNTPIVRDLVAAGPSAAERLSQIGERVGLPAHGRSHSYFIIAPLISTLLLEIELGFYSNIPGAMNLAAAGPTRNAVSEIIHHWVIISGRDVKAPRSTLSPALAPSRAVASTPPSMGSSMATVATGVPSSNGNGKVPVG
jgi:hypothetical protein